jgi:hypothetical protein
VEFVFKRGIGKTIILPPLTIIAFPGKIPDIFLSSPTSVGRKISDVGGRGPGGADAGRRKL